MLLIVGIIVGLIIGIIIGGILMASKIGEGAYGQLIITNQDIENPQPEVFLELDKTVDEVCQRDYIKLRVNKSLYTPRK